MNPFVLLFDKRDWFFDLLLQHIGISLVSIALAAFIGLSIGIGIAQWKRGAKPMLALVNFVYTIPSIALFGFLIPVTGIGNLTAIIALTIYALLPMVRNTYTGLTTIDPAIIEAARGMGSTERQLLYRIELPLASPVIMSGVRNMATMTIALAGIASFIGAGGLGVAIYRGITTNNPGMTLAGSLLIAALAITVDLLLGLAEKSTRHHLNPQRTGWLSRKRGKRASENTSEKFNHEKVRPTGRRRAVVVIGTALVVLAAGGTYAALNISTNSSTIHIATKPMTEQYILGEMLNTLIENNTNLTVELTPGVGGGTSNIQPGMEKGDFDLYPEYTGTGWNAVLKHEGTYDESMFDSLQQEYESRLGLTWIGMYGFNNTFGLGVRADIAQRYGLHTYSDRARVATALSLGAEPDFYDRQDGYPGLSAAYDMKFGTTRDMDISLKYQALFEGQVDTIVVATTDGQAADPRLVILEDDRHFYPSYLCGNVVRIDTLSAHPELKAQLKKLQGSISDTDMARMNNEVETQGREPKAVADAFLAERGLL